MCIIWKALCPYVLDARLGLWVSLGTRLYLCMYIVQPTKPSNTQVLPTCWLGRSMRGLQPGGCVHKEAVHLLLCEDLMHCQWCVAAVPEFYGRVSLALKVNTTLNAMWWTLDDVSNSSYRDDQKRLWMTSFNQRIAPSSVLSMATNYGYETMSYSLVVGIITLSITIDATV